SAIAEFWRCSHGSEYASRLRNVPPRRSPSTSRADVEPVRIWQGRHLYDGFAQASHRHTVREANILNAEPETSAAAAGLIGWLMKFGAVMIPTVGLFIRSQAFLQALVMSKDSSAAYGNSKALVGLGFSEGDALRFERQLREAGVLVSVAWPVDD